MDPMEIVVIAGGVALIGLTLWYFFGEREKVAAETNETGVQEIKVTVKGGYAPDVIVVKKDVPVRLNFYRDETSSCSEQVANEATADASAHDGDPGSPGRARRDRFRRRGERRDGDRERVEDDERPHEERDPAEREQEVADERRELADVLLLLLRLLERTYTVQAG